MMETTKPIQNGQLTKKKRLQYYRDQIEALTPPSTDFDKSKIEMFEELIQYVEETVERA